MKVVAIIQARMGSTRLPGKVIADVAGEPMLVRVARRCRRARLVDQVVVATTVEGEDDPVQTLCESQNWPCFRGSEGDVLDRYYQAALHFGANSVVRITADCPLIEPTVIDEVIEVFRSSETDVDYVSNTMPPRTYPRGLDVEVMSRAALTRAWHEDDRPTSREHVTPYIWRHPDQFHLLAIRSEKDYSHMRWTVDTSEDMSFVRQVYAHFGGDDFSWHDVLELLSQRPELLAINHHVLQKEV